MNQSKNYTPLHIRGFGKPNIFSTASLSLGAFIAGAVIISIVYVGTQSAKQQSYKTNASEPKPVCITEISNPHSAQAFMAESSDVREIFQKETVSTSSVTLQWEPAPDAEGYYVTLSNDPYAKSGAVDPAEKGVKVSGTSREFHDLQAGQTYYFLIRSVNKKGVVALTYPTIGNCRYVVGALPIFEFNTKQNE